MTALNFRLSEEVLKIAPVKQTICWEGLDLNKGAEREFLVRVQKCKMATCNVGKLVNLKHCVFQAIDVTFL